VGGAERGGRGAFDDGAGYTKRYDAIVRIHRVSPDTNLWNCFGRPQRSSEYFEYFLNPANHKPGIPLDFISYHSMRNHTSQTIADWQYTFFDQADGFLNTFITLRTFESAFTADEDRYRQLELFFLPTTTGGQNPPPAAYWNLAGSLYAYLFIELSQLQIDVIGESQLIGILHSFPA